MASDHQPDKTMARQVSVPAGSPWYQGHFPGDPLLPGIAQLDLVLETVRGALEGPVRLVGLKRIRFKRIIRPDETIDITVDPLPDKPGTYRFLLAVDGEIACSGVILTI